MENEETYTQTNSKNQDELNKGNFCKQIFFNAKFVFNKKGESYASFYFPIDTSTQSSNEAN